VREQNSSAFFRNFETGYPGVVRLPAQAGNLPLQSHQFH